MTIKVMAAAVLALAAMVVPAAASDEAHVIAQVSTGKLGREVAMLVCVNPDQVNVGVAGEIIHETGGLVAGLGFPINAQDRTALNLASVPGVPAVGNFSIALWIEADDTLGTSASCDVVYYSGLPLREVDSRPLTVRKYVKR